METRASYTIVGAFVLTFLIALVAALVWLSDVEVDGDFAQYDILFDGSVTGLKEGNPVRYRGVPVGVVTGIEINKQNVEQVRVTIEVPRDTPIKEDAVASLEFQGLTGVGYVEISGGSHNAPPLQRMGEAPRPVIPSEPSQLQAVFDRAPELVNRFVALVDRANLLLNEDNRKHIGDILANVNALTGELKTGSENLRRVLAQADRTLKAYDGLATDVKGEIGPTARQARETMEQLEASVEKLEAVTDRFGVAADSVSATAFEAETILRDNRESISHFTGAGLYEFTQLMAEARILVSNLTRITEELERDPAQYLFGDSQEGFKAE